MFKNFITDVLPFTSEWRLTADGDFMALAVDTNSDPVDYIFTRAALTEHHSLLPEILDKLYQHGKKTRRDTIAGVDVCHTLTLLHHPPIILQATDGREYTFADVDRIFMPDEHDAGGTALSFDGYSINTEEHQIGEQTIHLVTESYYATYYVEPSELDKRYPGWHERLAIALQLGVEQEERMRYIFTNAQTAENNAVSIDLLFD